MKQRVFSINVARETFHPSAKHSATNWSAIKQQGKKCVWALMAFDLAEISWI